MTFLRILLPVCLAASFLLAQPISLTYKPIDVQYSKTLDRLIMSSANPPSVHLVNPVNGTETIVNLSLVPLSLSVSPDGTHAAVGHYGWISYVNLSLGYVEKDLAVPITASVVILAGNGNIWVPPASSTINIATGVQTPSTLSVYGTTHPAVHPNGNWIYNTSDPSPPTLGKGDMSSGTYRFLYIYPYLDSGFPTCGSIFYSADGNRLLTGCGTLFRTTGSQNDDMTYSGTLSAAQVVTAGADSAVSREFVVIPGIRTYGTPSTDTEIQFYDDSYLTLLGRVPLPTYTSGSISAPWHGRFLFYSADSSKLHAVLQADSKANLANDYAIYTLTLSTGSGCGPSFGASSPNVPAGGGNVNVMVTAIDGCLWQASSNATWLFVSAGGVSSGNGTVTIQTAPNLQPVSRAGTVTIAGLTYTVIQDAAASIGVSPVSLSPVRPIAADYSAALDRMILVSTNPDLLSIFDPVTGVSKGIPLVMPPTALSISPDGLHAAVGHDGRISYVNLSTASVEKTFPVTTTIYSLALGTTDIYAFPLRNQYEAVRVVNIASGAETLWNLIWAGSTAGKITPNGKYLYLNAARRYDISAGPPPWVFEPITTQDPLQWFSQDSQQLFSGLGSVYRLSAVASQDLQYNGTIGGVQAVADSAAQQVTAVIASASYADSAINFVGGPFLAHLGSISIPKFTLGTKSYDAHGRYLFWNSAGNKLFAIVQADPTSGFLNDYAIYTLSFAGGCNAAFDRSTASVTAGGGAFTTSITATSGCAWRAVTSASWLIILANAVSSGGTSISYLVDPNPTSSARTATITVDGMTLVVTQAAGTGSNSGNIEQGVYRNGAWYVDWNGNNQWDATDAAHVFSFGLPGDLPVMGDWNGDGRLKAGVFRKGAWYVDWNGNNQWDATDAAHVFSFGLPGDLPVMGDWNGDGRLKAGVYRNGSWYVDWNGNNQWDATDAAHVFSFGLPGDLPVMGDWNGDGWLKAGVFRKGAWYVDWNGNNQWDATDAAHIFSFGLPDDLPVMGDWNGDGLLKVGVYRKGAWYVDWNGNNQWDATDAAHVFSFGLPDDLPVLGAWN